MSTVVVNIIFNFCFSVLIFFYLKFLNCHFDLFDFLKLSDLPALLYFSFSAIFNIFLISISVLIEATGELNIDLNLLYIFHFLTLIFLSLKNNGSPKQCSIKFIFFKTFLFRIIM